MNWKFWLGMIAGGIVGMAAVASVCIVKPDIAQRVMDGGKRMFQCKKQMMENMG
ncbi:MAG: hypothetical protein Q8O09_04540 [Bacillota bacterium]|nr:hypothetical protein [Bacillota bacterium]